MLLFKNSNDGSEKTSAIFGFYRKVCFNGLHVLQEKLAFSIRQTKNNTGLIMPRVNHMFDAFLDNEFCSIVQKFDTMKSINIIDTKTFVKDILEKTKLFKYECSDKNEDPYKKPREVFEILNQEGLLLNENPNLWLGYNTFNTILRDTYKKPSRNRKN